MVSRRELVLLTNELVDKMINDKIDTNKFFNWKEFLDLKVVELDIGEIENGKIKRPIYILKYCEKHKWACHFFASGKCNRCKSEESGLGNPEIHQKTIKNQIKNGTFNMLDPEIQKNKVSNENLKKEYIMKFCDECGKVTSHRKFKVGGKTHCNVCLAKNNGIRMKYCKVCKISTLHNGIVCGECVEGAVPPIPKFENKLCDDCGLVFLHLGNCCLNCKPDSGGSIKLPVFQIEKNVRYYKGERIESVIEKLETGEYNVKDFPGWNKRFDRWCYYTSDVLTDETLLLPNDRFSILNGSRYYKGEKVESVINKLENGEYDVKDFPGWNKRFDRWCYNTMDVLTDETLLLNGLNFEIHNEERFYLDKTTGKYVPWNDYKEKFKVEHNNRQLEEFKECVTFLSQDSDDWTGAKGAFEELLLEKNLNWIVYVKYYINGESEFNPLVIGKTGSKLVNSSGTDVSFDYDKDGGPARQFLIEEGYDWNKTQVGIIGCDSEEEALVLESKLQKKYKLFCS